MTALITLNTLADQINQEHELAEQAAQTAIEHAWRVGELLIQAKTKVNHGEWIPWIEANLNVGARQTQKYMRLHVMHQELPEPNTNSDSHLTIDAALESVADPRPDNKFIPHESMAMMHSNSRGDLWHIQPSEEHSGYYYAAYMIHADNGGMLESLKKPVSGGVLEDILKRMRLSNPKSADWELVEPFRKNDDGYEFMYHPKRQPHMDDEVVA